MTNNDQQRKNFATYQGKKKKKFIRGKRKCEGRLFLIKTPLSRANKSWRPELLAAYEVHTS
jgi:hypothetical protein